mmetsp:Transcript_86941/g.270312  ORF Transcript_86941/g.270312 Transcript_86941/m.270312 type:complete len:213 (-) Transcript_86941:914-1552(-)
MVLRDDGVPPALRLRLRRGRGGAGRAGGGTGAPRGTLLLPLVREPLGEGTRAGAGMVFCGLLGDVAQAPPERALGRRLGARAADGLPALGRRGRRDAGAGPSLQGRPQHDSLLSPGCHLQHGLTPLAAGELVRELPDAIWHCRLLLKGGAVPDQELLEADLALAGHLPPEELIPDSWYAAPVVQSLHAPENPLDGLPANLTISSMPFLRKCS